MHRFSPFLFAIVMSTSLLAQTTVDWANLDKKSTMEIVAVTKYCANVEDYSNYQAPRIFARTTSAYGQSASWVQYDTRGAWGQAGSPKPVALVWYRDAKIVRVKISSSDDESPRVHADYCYRKDGSLARLRSEPSVRRKCQPNGSQCTLVLRAVRLYPPEGQVLTTYGVDIHLNADGGLIVEQESAGAERIVENFVPMNWPEYRNVTDLPFSELLYANLR
ncbi:MAG: hypothetical protein WA485_24505 [Candidatus Sulfotelmatobacter sp.]